MHGGFFGLGDPEDVFEFDGNLAGNVLTTEADVGREPFGGVFVGFLLVGGAIDGEEVEGVLAEGFALGFVQAIGAGSPGVGQRDNVVDLDGVGCADTADEVDGLAGVGVVEGAR